MKHNRLKVASVGAAFFCFSIVSLSAQIKTDSASVWNVYFSGGWKQSNVTDLNERFAANNYPAFKENWATTGVGFQENKERAVGILELFASNMQENRSEGKIFSHFDFLVNVNFGYEVFKNELFSFYPTAGLGYGGQYFSISTDRDFNEILKNPVEQNVTLWNHNLAINAALNADYMIAAGETPNNRLRFFLIGLRGGYTFAPLYRWMQNNSMVEVANSPEANLTGAFVQLKLGVSTKEK